MKGQARFVAHLRPLREHRGRFALALLGGLLYGVASGAGIPFLFKEVIPKAFEGGDMDVAALIGWCLMPLGVMSVRALGGFCNTYFMAYCGQQILDATRQRLFDRIQQLPLAYFHRNDPGELISRAMQDSLLLRNVLTRLAEDVVKQPVTLLVAIGWLVFLTIAEREAAYLLLFIATVPLCILPIRHFGRRIAKRAESMLEQQAAVTRNLSQNLSATYEIRAFGLEGRESSRFREACSEFSRRFLKVALYSNGLSPLIEIISAAGIGVALFYTYSAQISQGVFLSLLSALYLCYEPVKRLGRLNNHVSEGRAALKRIESVIQAENSIVDPLAPVSVQALDGPVEFRNVTFAYENEPVLRGVNALVKKGKTTALVGASGAGKSTFCNLIPRFFDVTSGEVCVGGIDVRALSIATLRGQLAIVPQQPVLFNESIENNIRIGRLDAPFEALEEAARKAHALDFIESFPDGWQTLCGDRGERLSGGQKQRIAIARAFLRDAPILILDEATSALDTESEREIQAALEILFRDRTVIVIAHRFSAIRLAEEILVFKDGQVLDSGSHEALYGRNAYYRSLYDMQMARGSDVG